MRPVRERVIGAGLLLALAAGVAVLASTGGAAARYAPPIDPGAFTTTIDNPYLPMRPGTRWVYEGRGGGGLERKVVEVTDRTRIVMGVACVEVRDTITVGGQVSEDSVDWVAQDRDGTVWAFSEAARTRAEDGTFTPVGSWEAGVGGALPGVLMPGRPHPGRRYRQEYLPGEAEDMARV